MTQPPHPPQQYDSRHPSQRKDWQCQTQDGFYNQQYQDNGYDNYNTYQDDRRGLNVGHGRQDNFKNTQAYEPSRSRSHPQWGGHEASTNRSQYSQGYPLNEHYNQYPYDGWGRYGDGSRSFNSREMSRLPQQQRPGPSWEPPPPSPVKSSWDSPFPVFESKGKRKDSSVGVGFDKAIAGLSISDKPGPENIPERSQTSHSNHPGTLKPPGHIPHSPDHHRHADNETFGHGPGSNNQGLDMPTSGYEGADPVRHPPGVSYTDSRVPLQIMPLKKSATTPIPPIHSASQQRKPQYPGQATYQEPIVSPMSGYKTDLLTQPPPRPSTTGTLRPVKNHSKPNLDPPSFNASKYSQDGDASDDFLADYFDTSENTEGDEPDMPNFDAIPDGRRMGVSVDHNLIPGFEQLAIPTPASPQDPSILKQYAAYNPELAAQPQHAQPQTHLNRGNGLNHPQNSRFQFSLPDETPSLLHMPRRNSIGVRGPPRRAHSGGQGAYESRGPPQQLGDPMQIPRGNGPTRPYRITEPESVGDQQKTGNGTGSNHPDEPQDPDSLPHHPTPFRPGLDQGPKPPPVRQYTRPHLPTGPPSQESHQGCYQDNSPSRPVTHEEIQKLQRMVHDNPNDYKSQLTLAKKLVEAASVLAGEEGRVDPKTRNKNRERYIMDAYKIVKKLAHSGYTEAMFYLADCHGQGLLGLEADPKEAFLLYQSAAKQGHTDAAYRLAVCCELGQEDGGGTKRDPLKAVQWYKRAATLGNTPAMYKMGVILLKGLLGQQRNPREALTWLKRAAERANKENPHALHELALLYENAGNNDILIRDQEYAKELFTQAAELGYKFSQFRLGAAYECGLLGCPVDARQSIVWYTRSAAQGEHQSELALSGWYLTGAEGILQQSDTEAYLWARKAATAGLPKAEYAMGYFTEVGIGTPSNLEDAKRWYWRAASQNFIKARERLEDLMKGGDRMQKTRVSRSAVHKQNEADCVVM